MHADVQLHRWEVGRGDAVLCIHETATGADSWRPLAEALGDRARTIAYDRRGWGRSPAPETYTRTTIEEQAADAAAMVGELEAGPALVCGAGLGAVAALDLLLRRPELCRAAILIEPPLLAFLPEATEALSKDGDSLRKAVQDGGPAAGLELYLAGGLPALGPGAERLPAELTVAAGTRPLTLFAELGAVPAWRLPLAELTRMEVPVAIVTASSAPPLLDRAAEALAKRAAGAELRTLSAAGLAQLDAAGELAELALELA